MAKKQHFSSVKQLLQSDEPLYPTAHIVKYANRIYPSIRKAAKAEGVSTTHIRTYCKIYTREEIKETIVSQIRF